MRVIKGIRRQICLLSFSSRSPFFLMVRVTDCSVSSSKCFLPAFPLCSAGAPQQAVSASADELKDHWRVSYKNDGIDGLASCSLRVEAIS